MRRLLLLMSAVLAAPLSAQSSAQSSESGLRDDHLVEAQSGNDALANGAPWQAQIFSNFTGWTEDELDRRDEWDLAHRCGGSLIAPHWVLTAAHCIDQAKVDKGYRVRLGAVSIGDDEGATYLIDRMVRHADYDKPNHLNDIALVHFIADDQTVADDAGPVAQVPLYDGEPLGDDVAVTATGWGKLESGKGVGHQAELSRVDIATADCANFPAYEGRTTANMMCATAPGQDTCQGDSGGPLVLSTGTPVQVGIVNWGDGCNDPERPGVYLRIDRDHYFGWIRRAMALDPAQNSLGD